MQEVSASYAQFWRRALAFAIDFAIIRILINFADPAFDYVARSMLGDVQDGNDPEVFFKFALMTLALHWLVWGVYFLAFEQSRLKSTPGKILFKIQILDLERKIVSWPVCAVRNLYLLLPLALYQLVGVWIVTQELQINGSVDHLYENAMLGSPDDIRAIASIAVVSVLVINFIIMFFTSRKQMLHDLMAKTVVVGTDGQTLDNIIFNCKSIAKKAFGFIKGLRKANFTNHNSE
jgi:uncharacterized RDD family membrane protein YckC